MVYIIHSYYSWHFKLSVGIAYQNEIQDLISRELTPEDEQEIMDQLDELVNQEVIYTIARLLNTYPRARRKSFNCRPFQPKMLFTWMQWLNHSPKFPILLYQKKRQGKQMLLLFLHLNLFSLSLNSCIIQNPYRYFYTRNRSPPLKKTLNFNDQ